LAILKNVMQELEDIVADGRKLTIGCPVHYETLYRPSSWEQFNILCRRIPEEHRELLSLIVFDIPPAVQVGKLVTVATPLKKFCKHLNAEVPLISAADFHSLRFAGFDSVGATIRSGKNQEGETVKKMTRFAAAIKRHSIPRAFIFGITSSAFVTAAVIAEIDCIEGPIVHGIVSKPDEAHRFKYDDIYANFMKQGANSRSTEN